MYYRDITRALAEAREAEVERAAKQHALAGEILRSTGDLQICPSAPPSEIRAALNDRRTRVDRRSNQGGVLR
jgi:hypothetical protein